MHPAVLLRSLVEETMDFAWISLAALVIAITLSMVTSVNVGVVSLALAWIVGVYLGGMPVAKVIGTFPIDLLLNLVGITLLFGMANNNGTLGRIAARAVRACRGNAGVIPIMLFFIALGLSSIGPGNIATDGDHGADGDGRGLPRRRAALPDGADGRQRRAGRRASRFAPTGIIVNTNMEKIGLRRVRDPNYLNNLMAHAVVTFAAYFCSAAGGCSRSRRRRRRCRNRIRPARVRTRRSSISSRSIETLAHPCGAGGPGRVGDLVQARTSAWRR